MGVDYSTTAGFGFTLTDDEVYAAAVRLGVAPSLEVAQEEFASEVIEYVLRAINSEMRERYPDDSTGMGAGFFTAGTAYSTEPEDVHVVTSRALTVEEYGDSYHASMSIEEMTESSGFLTEVQELLGVDKPLEFHLGLHVY